MNRQSAVILAMIGLSAVAATSYRQVPQQTGQATGGSGAVDTATWKMYRDEKNGFQLRYPETWVVKSGRGTGFEMITIGKPYGSGDPNAQLTVAVQKNRNPKKLSIEEWFAEQLKLMHASPESSGNVTVGGHPAVFMENTNSFGKQRQIFTLPLLHEEDVLSLSFRRQAELDATYAAMVGTLRLLK